MFFLDMTIKMKQIDGDETIEFVAFNIDGEGTSLAILEGDTLSLYSKEETLSILIGRKGENPEYELVK